MSVDLSGLLSSGKMIDSLGSYGEMTVNDFNNQASAYSWRALRRLGVKPLMVSLLDETREIRLKPVYLEMAVPYNATVSLGAIATLSQIERLVSDSSLQFDAVVPGVTVGPLPNPIEALPASLKSQEIHEETDLSVSAHELELMVNYFNRHAVRETQGKRSGKYQELVWNLF